MNRNGRLVHAPKKPLLSKWQWPTVCAPMSATVSVSVSDMRANLARTLAGAKEPTFGGRVSGVTAPLNPSPMASGSTSSAAGAVRHGRSTRPARHGMVGPCIAATARTPASV